MKKQSLMMCIFYLICQLYESFGLNHRIIIFQLVNCEEMFDNS